MTEKLLLELALVLPSIPDERDACIGRLIDVLQTQGLEKVHVRQQTAIRFYASTTTLHISVCSR